VDGTTTQYAYDGVRLLKELDANGATQMTYTLAPLGDEWYPLVSHRKSGASRFYAFDALGTTRALTDGSEDVAAVFTDDAWGNVLNASDSSATAHQYVGRYGYYLDGASGLQLLTQRYYDSTVGRFVSEDPVRARGNWQCYVGANAVDAADPSGLDTQTCFDGNHMLICINGTCWDFQPLREPGGWYCPTFLGSIQQQPGPLPDWLCVEEDTTPEEEESMICYIYSYRRYPPPFLPGYCCWNWALAVWEAREGNWCAGGPQPPPPPPPPPADPPDPCFFGMPDLRPGECITCNGRVICG